MAFTLAEKIIDIGTLVTFGIICIPIVAYAVLDRFGLLKEWFGIPSQYEARLEKKIQEAEDEAREIAKYRNLSDEGKLLHELVEDKKRAATTRRQIAGVFLAMLVIAGFLFILIFFKSQ
ncbi:hypothetical protein Enr10x_58510 [Gimesia panareensis]|uniref:Uncharacterized protein n=1 Tax=Gimesia panareensis TaxID=2527978 RepID=A0A517QFY1_9PLAN|nr:hypothetical protein [Gimesia panareensis]QDT30485.1 hypothetical protein Enr10x_58510 [Gimesia panareensis]